MGFRLSIEATAATDDSRYESTYFIKEANGTFKYPEQGNYRANDRVLTVLQLSNQNSLKISTLFTEGGYDILHTFAIPPFAANAGAIYNGG